MGVPQEQCGSSWLGMLAIDRDFYGNHVHLCENELVHKEGFGCPIIFTRVTPQFFNSDYLKSLNIVGKGVQQFLLNLHTDLRSQLETAPRKMSNGKATLQRRRGVDLEAAARFAVKKVLAHYALNFTEMAFVLTTPERNYEQCWKWGSSFWGIFLTQRGVNAKLVMLCEEILVHQEGFSSPLILARTPEVHFNREYLNNVGITPMALRETVLTLYSDLRLEFTDIRNAPYPGAGPESRARAAVRVVLPDYVNNISRSTSATATEAALVRTSRAEAAPPLELDMGEGCWESLDEEDNWAIARA